MIKKIVYVLLAIFITACSTNGWLISTFYNRVDNLLVNRFSEYADFNDQQLGWVEEMAGSYHDWHRASELPRYAAFMREIEARMGNGGPITRGRAESWVDTAVGFSVAVENCNPLNNAFPLLVSLTDQQVLQVEVELERTYQEYIEELERLDPQQRREQRFKMINKWLGRVGLRLNDEQRELLRATIAGHRPFQRDGLDLWRVWNSEFVELLQERKAVDFEPRMAHHLTGLWNLSKDKYPGEWHVNYQLWVDFFHQLLNMQTDQQGERFASWLLAMSDTLDGLAQPPDERLLAARSQDYESCAAGVRELAVNREL